ncbi:DNA polymerase, partial [Acinetobacter baumannii]
LAMIAVDKILPKDQAKLLLQVHDELVFEADQNIAEELSKQIASVMESVVEISVPLVVEVGQGQNWDDSQ